MRKLLPVFFSFIFLIVGLVTPLSTYAQTIDTTATSPTPANPAGQWQKDQEVTFIGKTAARANDFLEWTLQNYQWISITPDNPVNPLMGFWGVIRNIVLAMLVLFVLAAAFVIIITRGQNVTIMRFIPRFIFIVVLIVFSFALIRFLYQFFDVIQGFFLRTSDPSGGPDRFIGPQDLLYIAFDYKNFIGFRQVGIEFDESAYISLLLVKITAVTYYVMTGILLIRKIILWFFVIISPVFPLLLFFRPLRNTAKIWIGEFFRWLLYAPIFAIFLHGLVVMWRDRIPLSFDFSQVGNQVYPTAINILLGGPGQQIGINNSVNLRDTFALYVVALLMLWVVILLPFLLLQIFLDYLNNLSLTETPLYQRIVSTNIPFINRTIGKGPDIPPTTPPKGPATTGLARALPFLNKKAMQIPIKRLAGVERSQRVTAVSHETSDVLRLANLSIPKMRDIARIESSSITRNQTVRQEASETTSKLSHIGMPASATPIEREKFTTIKERLIEQQKKGDPLARSILAASNIGVQVGLRGRETAERIKSRLSLTLQHIAHPTSILTPQERQKIQDIRQELLSAQGQGNPLATYVLDMSEKIADEKVSDAEKQSLVDKIKEKLFSEKEKGNKLAEKILPQEGESAVSGIVLPSVNRVQEVSIDEYEEVKNIWKDNYANMEPPTPLDGNTPTKEEWISRDMEKINETVNLLSSPDQNQVQKGMEMVSDALPFLLIGGFSKAEVIAYLKAKLEAAKEVLDSIQHKKSEEDTLLENRTKQEEAQKTMVMHEELPGEEKKPEQLPNDDNGQNKT